MALSSRVLLAFFITFFMVFLMVSADLTESRYRTGACIRNCAMCKKMYGPFFEGDTCAQFCLKYKGKFIPDCQDEDSIRQFVTAIDDD